MSPDAPASLQRQAYIVIRNPQSLLSEVRLRDASSDGDPTRWPHASDDLEPLSAAVLKYWLTFYIPPIVKALGLESNRFEIKALPYGYKAFRYTNTTDGAQARYLIAGGPHNFHTKEEFLPHYLWLATGCEQPCECRYCKVHPVPPPAPKQQSLVVRVPSAPKQAALIMGVPPASQLHADRVGGSSGSATPPKSAIPSKMAIPPKGSVLEPGVSKNAAPAKNMMLNQNANAAPAKNPASRTASISTQNPNLKRSRGSASNESTPTPATAKKSIRKPRDAAGRFQNAHSAKSGESSVSEAERSNGGGRKKARKPVARPPPVDRTFKAYTRYPFRAHKPLLTQLQDPIPAPRARANPRRADALRTKIEPYHSSMVSVTRDMDFLHYSSLRKGELCWLRLYTPLALRLTSIPGVYSEDPEATITQWPAIVSACEYFTLPKAILDEDGEKSVDVLKKRKFSVQLLHLDQTCTVIFDDDDEFFELAPWHVHSAQAQWENLTRDYEDSLLALIFHTSDLSLIYSENGLQYPRLSTLYTVADEAGGAASIIVLYALALHSSSRIIQSYSLHNCYTPMRRNGISPPTFQNMKHYESIWLGPERVWVGEMVRMLTDPLCFIGSKKRNGLNPSPSILSTYLNEGRSLFLKIKGIYKDSVNNNYKAYGTLYYLSNHSPQNKDADESPNITRTSGTLFDEFRYRPYPIPEPHPMAHFVPVPYETSVVLGEYITRQSNTGAGTLDIHMDIKYIAGRYYSLPSHLQDPKNRLAILKQESEGNGDLTPEQRWMTLAGLGPSFRLFTHTSFLEENREENVEHSEKHAARMFEVLYKSKGKDESRM